MGYVRCQPVPGSQVVQWGCIKFRLLFRPSTTDITIRYTTSSIHSNMWWKNQNRAERQFTQNSVRTEARKNLPENVMLLRGETAETGQNTTALIELVQVQGAHGMVARPLRLMGHLKRLHNRKKRSREKKNPAGTLGRIHCLCFEKPILQRLHGWKVFALIYQTPRKTLNNFRKRKQAKKPLQNSNYHEYFISGQPAWQAFAGERKGSFRRQRRGLGLGRPSRLELPFPCLSNACHAGQLIRIHSNTGNSINKTRATWERGRWPALVFRISFY